MGWIEKQREQQRAALHRLERSFSEHILPTADRFDMCVAVLGLPDDMQGMTLVDLVGGASSLVPRYLQQGIDAYSVDCAYELPPEEIQTRLDVSTARSREQLGREWVLFNKEQLNAEAAREFWQAFATFPDRFVPGWLTQVPLPNDLADYTVSSAGISNIGRTHTDLYEPMLDEALRLTKPGGKVIVAPVIESGTDRRMLNRITSKGHEARIERPSLLRYRDTLRLVIDKKG